MNNFGLFVVPVLIWGTTWLAITFQLGSVPPEVSVAYRFGLAGLILLAWCLVRRLRLAYAWREHAAMAAQGALLIGINYMCVYRAESLIASGYVAVIFSLLSPLNMLGSRAFFGTPLRAAALGGAALGVAGVALIFLPEVSRTSAQGHFLPGLGFGLVAVTCACHGNLLSARSQRRGLPVVQINTFSMLYGAALVTVFALAIGRPFVLNTSATYLLSLGYLALFGSVLAFGAYLTLLGRIGAGGAGYVNVIVPIVAVVVSACFEHLQWHPATGAGICLCLAGNVLVLRRPAKPGA